MTDEQRVAAALDLIRARSWATDAVVEVMTAPVAAVRRDERTAVYAQIAGSVKGVRLPRQPGRLDFEEQLSWS